MAIKTIDVMCIPCPKCEEVKKFIAIGIQEIETQNKIKLVHVLNHIPHLKEASKYSVNAAQAPIVIINGQVQFAGKVDQNIVTAKLKRAMMY
jgi:hypothetical protein